MKQLLCTFTNKYNLNRVISDINNTYSVSKIFVLKNLLTNQLMCTYNISDDESYKNRLKYTISLHRNKETNTLYTIDALNELIILLNDGKKDNQYKIDWNNYKNMLLITDDTGIKKIKTKIFKIINNDGTI